MRILFIHNSYQLKGGEDIVLEQEMNLLKKKGHVVDLFSLSNKSISSFIKKIRTAINLRHSKKSKLKIDFKIKTFSPNIVHVHNFFPLITPSVFDACVENNIPVIHTLHNYRLICPSGLLMYNNKIYEKAIIKGPFSTVLDKVYRDSYFGTFMLARMIDYHKKNKTWDTKINQFIVLTSFSKSKFLQAGFLENRISIKSNFVDYNGYSLKKEDYYVFVGRLSQEKGIPFLLECFSNINCKLIIIGTGPLEKQVLAAEKKYSNIKYLGFRDKSYVIDKIKSAKALIMSSICYEGMPMTMLESFSVGTAVIGPSIGGINEMIEDCINGLIYETGHLQNLISVIRTFNEDLDLQRRLSEGARKSFEQKYTVEKNYDLLMRIYNNAINEKEKNT